MEGTRYVRWAAWCFRLCCWMVVCGFTVTLGGCCSFRSARAAPIRDRFSTYLLVGIGVPPKCCLPPDQRRLYQTKRGAESSIWVRSVFHDNIRVPVAGIEIQLDVVDAFGDPMPDASVNPRSTVTTKNGFAKDRIRFVSNKIGTFRIRVSYPDRKAVTMSLSPTIVIVE
jgi:hypothetical protein